MSKNPQGDRDKDLSVVTHEGKMVTSDENCRLLYYFFTTFFP